MDSRFKTSSEGNSLKVSRTLTYTSSRETLSISSSTGMALAGSQYAAKFAARHCHSGDAEIQTVRRRSQSESDIYRASWALICRPYSDQNSGWSICCPTTSFICLNTAIVTPLVNLLALQRGSTAHRLADVSYATLRPRRYAADDTRSHRSCAPTPPRTDDGETTSDIAHSTLDTPAPSSPAGFSPRNRSV